MLNESKPSYHKADIENLLHHLDDVLDWERDALLKGDLDSIVRSLQSKEHLLDALSQIEIDTQAGLDALKQKATHNQHLLNSALEGIRAVADRIAALRQARNTLETYDKTGSKIVIGGLQGQSVEKRA